MAQQITINSENKSIEVAITAKSNINLEVSRSVSQSGVQNITAGNNIQISTGNNGNVTVATTNQLSVSGNITANYFIGNGSQLTGLPEQYGNANVAAYMPTYLNGNIASNVIPTGNLVYNLGSETHRWKDLYLSGNTIFLGESTISSGPNGISVSGNLSGDGSALTNLNAANVEGVFGNITVAVANFAIV